MRRLAFVVMATASLSLACSSQAPEAKAEAARKASARASAISAVASRHGADDTWASAFADRARVGIYTFEFQKALIRPNAAPVVLVGSLEDIVSVDTDQYEVRGRQSMAAGPTLYFSLRCGRDQLASLLSGGPDIRNMFAEYGIAATIDRITKPMLKVSAEPSADDYEGRGPEMSVEAGDAVMATGVCLEIAKLDD